MIRSMTGFGAAAGRVGAALVSVEIRSVNHRFFTPTIKLPASLSRWEGDVREILRKRVARGHVTLFCRFERDEQSSVLRIDEERFGRYVEQLRDLQLRHQLAPPDVATVLKLPDVMAAEAREAVDDAGAADLLALVEQAATALTAMRDEEGARLAGFLLERLHVVEHALDRIAVRAPERIVEHRDRLRLAVRNLTEGVAIDEQRLAQEIAILAERLDVHEELDRFRSHVQAFEEGVRAGSEPVGKRLGFLLQEMLREANTTGSKAADTAMLRDVVAIKEELERIREQVENVE
jgi:uncharacterized protein (TIGR00255 family)